MKHDCDIVRDLMPMCIDGTASEKAKAMVDEHVAECPPCEKVYAEMKGETKLELPVQPAAPEFVTTVRKMKNRRKRRTWLTLFTGVVIAAVVALAGFVGYFWYFVDMAVLETANLSLVTSNDGIALIRATNVPRSASIQLHVTEMEYPESAKGQYEVKVKVYATRFEKRHKGGAEIYFVIGNQEDNSIYIDEKGYGTIQVYRMLYGKNDGSGKVFYLSGEDELKAVSIKGAHLKSPESVSINSKLTVYSPYPFITPMPTSTSNWTYIITDENAVEIRMVSPTPEPQSTLEPKGYQPAQSTPIPAA